MLQPQQSPSKGLSPKASTLLMACSAAFIIAGYEFARSATNSLFKASYGMESYPLALAIVPLGVLLCLYLYGKCLSVYGPRKTLLITSLFSALAILLSYFGLVYGVRFSSFFMIVFKESYVVLIVEQYWSFINSVLDQQKARKMNGLILAISTLGALFADSIIFNFANQLGSHTLLLFTVICFVPAVYFADRAYSSLSSGSLKRITSGVKKAEIKDDDTYGLRLFKSEPTLILILMVIVTSQVYAAICTIIFQGALQDNIPSVDEQTAFSGGVFGLLNILSLFFQLVLSPLLLGRISLYKIHFAIPVIHGIAIAAVVFNMNLYTACGAFLVFKAVDYSIFRAAKEVLYIPLSFDARYRSKELIDVLGYRASKGVTSLCISLLQKAGWLVSSGSLSLCGLFAVLGWMGSLIPLVHRGQRNKS